MQTITAQANVQRDSFLHIEQWLNGENFKVCHYLKIFKQAYFFFPPLFQQIFDLHCYFHQLHCS